MKSENEQTFKEYINFETIRELDSIPDPSGGRLYNNLQALFLKNSPKTLEDLKTAIEIEDIPNIKQHAHKLKGMSSNLGGAKLASLLKQFEIEHTNPQKLKEMWPELEETYKKTIEYFEWVANHPPGELPDF
jgi:HPt (histidine-containing phosphotransfer) domain-containing protein